MIYAKLVIVPKPQTIEGQPPQVSVAFEWRGDKEGCKFWKNKFEAELPEKLGLNNVVIFCENFFAENEFWPGPISGMERVYFLPSKKFFAALADEEAEA